MKKFLYCPLIALVLAGCETTSTNNVLSPDGVPYEVINVEKKPDVHIVHQSDIDKIPKGYTERQIRISIGNPGEKYIKRDGKTVVLGYKIYEIEGLPHTINQCLILKDGYYRESTITRFNCSGIR
ncbi:hypothetical protein [Taylorella equigenitalis]|uniref:Lipoprotein n=3 Tax=Taylorella equigenitalis TaxID=29575 RepID=A0A654KG45_TAYEM|nr:hypothetical protein [Taylorella equigenitalis]ADU91413.1 hypothetical protein TEQUI_0470 [Taylorella equigenitalis MCE9]AFN36499.1 putative lipoprotein [Taylorella equigenitalis ATCC 35865]ASY31066.1 hypothetical protein B9Z30_06885 [Taylorella equigenitalis]ASY38368.1 hypothetical protein CA605_06805 [Taylorella equigenitalis]ASY39900.1 hypothetical protein CA604_07325 [Taylorella equigenitalis]